MDRYHALLTADDVRRITRGGTVPFVPELVDELLAYFVTEQRGQKLLTDICAIALDNRLRLTKRD